ncbi:exonuclease SbcCD subunit D [Micrococcus sp.]|uniref:exonuclease SbcCD subunit D n=1 Tax=Micrococcus sp. TaxID=1271 RepID=UPI002A911F62|nr:exonuclease SbcCD subunit D [Micrococcus sp.]MDY6055697.1 exonuclease SbcCD subunit D [Micrococcus sp.]
MILLHTSDWHLGRSFHGTGLLAAQEEAMEAMLATVREHAVDAVLVAGDVYDRALPPADAVRLLDRTLARLQAEGVPVVLTSGNHDSAVRLGFGGALMAAAGVHVRTDPDACAEPVVLTERDEGGAVVQQVAVYGLPYLEPRHQGPAWGVAPHHTAVTTEAVRRIRADLTARRADAQTPVASVVMAHLFAAGGEGSDSERDIGEGEHPAPQEAPHQAPEALVGTLGQVPVGVFDGLDYAALGHLHGRQRLTESVRYSGSPLPYSFSEARHRKGAWLVHMEAGALTRVQEVDWEAGRRLAVLSGTLEDLLSSPEHAWAEERWVQATVTDDERPERALERLKSRFPHVLVFRHEPAGGPRARTRTYARLLRETPSDHALAVGFVDHVRQRPATGPEQDLLRDALEAARLKEAQA